ncbi:MAG TPA: cyclase family protein [Pyrinomonadaceae bacterium]|nr:cyclase family protein [Pyrinomonadaceae bacterium]
MFVDISHTVEHGMITYKGLPAPVISDFLSREDSRSHYDEGTEFNIARIDMVANTGTYLDSPFHRYARGKDLAHLDLSAIANVDGIVVRSSERAISEHALEGVDIKGKAVLFHTGWDVHWRTDTYSNGEHPFLTEGAAEYLAKGGATIVGIDSYNIDSTSSGKRPAHSILLGHDIPIVEHLCGLGELPESGFKFFAVPVKVRHFGTFPVRAFAIV